MEIRYPSTLLVGMKIGRTTWKTVWRYFRKLNIELPYEPAIPLFGIYLDKNFLEKDTCTRMFISALFTLAKVCKQLQDPLTHEWTKKTWYTYRTEYYSVIEKNKILASKQCG